MKKSASLFKQVRYPGPVTDGTMNGRLKAQRYHLLLFFKNAVSTGGNVVIGGMEPPDAVAAADIRYHDYH